MRSYTADSDFLNSTAMFINSVDHILTNEVGQGRGGMGLHQKLVESDTVSNLKRSIHHSGMREFSG